MRALSRAALVLGVILAVPALVEWTRDPLQFYRSYLVAFLFVLAPALGSLAWILLHRLTGGRWGEALAEVLASAATTLPFVALLFVPVFLGLERIFPWADPKESIPGLPALHQEIYLQRPFFTARAALYFLVWAGLARLVTRRAPPQSPASRYPVAIGAVGMLAYFLTTTLSSVDWGMSLSPGWTSSLYGLLTIVAYALSALSTAILFRLLVARLTGSEVPSGTLHDFGNLLFAGVMTWAYLSFSQLLIIWSANLPEEVTWYVDRLGSGWGPLGAALLVAHFFLPFFLLLSRKIKRHVAALAAVSTLVLIARLPEQIWMIVPSYRPQAGFMHWLDVVLPVGLFALWCSLVLHIIGRRLAALEGQASSGAQTT